MKNIINRHILVLCIIACFLLQACKHRFYKSNVNVTITNSYQFITDVGTFDDFNSFIKRMRESQIREVSIKSNRKLLHEVLENYNIEFKKAKIKVLAFYVPVSSYIVGYANLSSQSCILIIQPLESSITYMLGFDRFSNSHFDTKNFIALVKFMKNRNIKSVNIISDEELPHELEKSIYDQLSNAEIKIASFYSFRENPVGFANIVINGKFLRDAGATDARDAGSGNAGWECGVGMRGHTYAIGNAGSHLRYWECGVTPNECGVTPTLLTFKGMRGHT